MEKTQALNKIQNFSNKFGFDIKEYKNDFYNYVFNISVPNEKYFMTVRENKNGKIEVIASLDEPTELDNVLTNIEKVFYNNS